MIACSCCESSFRPSSDTYVGTQVWPGSVLILHNCPNIKAGDLCGSTRAIAMFRDDFDDQEPIAAE